MSPYRFAAKTDSVIILWLWGVFLLILAMVMLGGATRLTHAGLSIVEWKPITGIIPPLSFDDWMLEFQNYKRTPEYLLINNGMSLNDFKFIFWMEYSHRLLGRFIGFYILLPMFYFWTQRMLNTRLKCTCFTLLFLGGLQGVIGWYMVKSGLVNDPHVSPFRLSVHLLMAFALAGITIKELNRLQKDKHVSGKSMMWSTINLILIVLTVFYGALVAGHKAGFIYNTFPLMEGYWLPSEWNYIKPLWHNFVENPATIQFIHRQLAYLVFCSTIIGVWKNWVSIWYAFAIGIQLALGIVTLLYHVPVLLGTLHQGWALAIFSMAFNNYLNHKKPDEYYSGSLLL